MDLSQCHHGLALKYFHCPQSLLLLIFNGSLFLSAVPRPGVFLGSFRSVALNIHIILHIQELLVASWSTPLSQPLFFISHLADYTKLGNGLMAKHLLELQFLSLLGLLCPYSLCARQCLQTWIIPFITNFSGWLCCEHCNNPIQLWKPGYVLSIWSGDVLKEIRSQTSNNLFQHLCCKPQHPAYKLIWRYLASVTWRLSSPVFHIWEWDSLGSYGILMHVHFW